MLTMAISSVCSGCNATSYSPANQDPQVRALKAKINDWETCPTTDSQTKKAIVGRLQIQLDGVTSAIQSHEQSVPKPVAQDGRESTLDIRA